MTGDVPELPDGVSERGIAPESGSLDFRCEDCSAVMAWDPDADALKCEFCGGRREIEAGGDVIREYALSEAGAAAGSPRCCARDVPGDTHRFLRVRNRFSAVRWKHVLLPMWSPTFTWKGERYPVLVHGQTGRVVGRALWSWVKIALFALVLAAVIGGGAVLMSAR